MTAYESCSSCARYIKARESSCPFCSAVHAQGPGAARRFSRISRARWLAFGSTLAVVGCQGGATDTFQCVTYDGRTHACVRAMEYCRSGSASCGPLGCISMPSACVDSPGCACLSEAGAFSNANLSCSEKDAGIVGVTCSCYGSPPARLERLERRHDERGLQARPGASSTPRAARSRRRCRCEGGRRPANCRFPSV